MTKEQNTARGHQCSFHEAIQYRTGGGLALLIFFLLTVLLESWTPPFSTINAFACVGTYGWKLEPNLYPGLGFPLLKMAPESFIRCVSNIKKKSGYLLWHFYTAAKTCYTETLSIANHFRILNEPQNVTWHEIAKLISKKNLQIIQYSVLGFIALIF